jgi:monovalent cation:proton antiporter-2 (CPA2) family protein
MFLYTFVILLTAAILAVPLAKRLGFGSVLGYLGAGLVIGPAGLGLVSDVESIAQVSEFGVVMLLFLIGLELRPARVWTMRGSVFGLGAAQVVLTTLIMAGVSHLAGLPWPTAVVLGFAFSMSSTAIVLPMLAERDLLTSHAGRDGFAVLLFQDLAVIPAVALIPLLQGGMGMTGNIWLPIGKAVAALFLVFVGGRYLIRPIFRLVDSAKTPEIFTATALAVVTGTAGLVNTAGLSMSLGAFMAGVLLSGSEYRHQIRADIEPFEGLLLGIFFISVGMAANLGLLGSEAGVILSAVAGLLFIKIVLGFVLARLFKQGVRDAMRFAVALCQAGEFGFVLFGVAMTNGILDAAQSERAMLVVTLSMIAAPLLFWASEQWIVPLLSRTTPRPFDALPSGTPVIICGFGRVGQIVGRILRMREIPFTALDKNAEQIDQVRRFGSQAFYGDATRLDLLRAAGAAEAKLVVVALDDVGESLTVVDLVKRHFPAAKVLARARNRRHAHLLMDRGVEEIVRETFHSSLILSERTMIALGVDPKEAERTAEIFAERDEKLLLESHGYYDDEKQLIQSTQQIAEELHGLLEADQKAA